MECGFVPKTHIWIFTVAILAMAITGAPRRANAQDAFEIRVEEYEKPIFGGVTLEEHLNDVGIGTTGFNDRVAPTNHQLHMSTELTAGITGHMSLGMMVMTAVVPGRGELDYAGWRVLPHFYLPDTWHLPVKIGLTTEFSFQPTLFDQSTRTLELRPIIEQQIGRVLVDINPSAVVSLSGPTRNQWNFEPSLRFACEVTPRLHLALEYYGSTGPLSHLQPVNEQVHQIYPDAVIQLTKKLSWDFGVGAGLTPAGNRLVYKTRIEFSFGRKGHDAKQ